MKQLVKRVMEQKQGQRIEMPAPAPILNRQSIVAAPGYLFWRVSMKTFRLPLVAAVAMVASMGALAGAFTIGSAGAMPFSSNTAAPGASLVQDVRVVCNRNGHCWNTDRRYRSVRRGYAPGYYERPGYYAEPRYGYYGGPRVGVGIGPFGLGIY
jgi:hypothetical protein